MRKNNDLEEHLKREKKPKTLNERISNISEEFHSKMGESRKIRDISVRNIMLKAELTSGKSIFSIDDIGNYVIQIGDNENPYNFTDITVVDFTEIQDYFLINKSNPSENEMSRIISEYKKELKEKNHVIVKMDNDNYLTIRKNYESNNK